MYIRYLDRYRRDDGVWRFAERETFVEWTADQLVPPDRDRTNLAFWYRVGDAASGRAVGGRTVPNT